MSTGSGKRFRTSREAVPRLNEFPVDEACATVKKHAQAKFDETVDVAVRLGVQPKYADQMVRGAVNLPHGTGKSVTVLAVASGEKVTEAEQAGADIAGGEEIVEKIKGGWMEFDKVVATPDMMKHLGKVGRMLGPRGLMPSPKTGTVTFDLASIIGELKAGKVEFKVDKEGNIHTAIGKASFGAEQLQANLLALMEKLIRIRPSSAKGTYLRNITISSTMGPGVRVDPNDVQRLLR
jgi:large subunit ribosomal protein L1